MDSSIQEIIKATQLSEEIKRVKSGNEEMQEIFQSLEEAIIVVKNHAISFSNDIFKGIMDQVNEASDQLGINNPYEQPMFKIFRKTQDSDPEEKVNLTQNFVCELSENLLSIKNILLKPQEFFADKVF